MKMEKNNGWIKAETNDEDGDGEIRLSLVYFLRPKKLSMARELG